ncbi:hypothetical protein GCM10009690_19860 [Brevibacterium permense]|uniref:Uncharacterized protein n=1 Tax=Brevibacterium permense TaxID=234834 RepID=A0ABN2AD43_9MICO
MDVVAAGMGDAGNSGTEILIDEVINRQGIDIGSQSHGYRPLADLADDPGALEALGPETCGLEAGDDLVGGLELLEGQFRMGMDVAAEIDEFCTDLSDCRADHVGSFSAGRSGMGDVEHFKQC